MITLLDLCSPSQTFLVLFFATICIVSFNYYTQPVQPFCIRRFSPDDCGEKRKDYIIHVLIVSLLALLWTWILNIVFHTFSPLIAWFLVFLPFLSILLWFGYNFIPTYSAPVPVDSTKSYFFDVIHDY